MSRDSPFPPQHVVMFTVLIMLYQIVMAEIESQAYKDMEFEIEEGEVQPEEGESIIVTIPGIHLAFESVHSRLNLFTQLAQINPESVEMISRIENINQMVCFLSVFCFEFILTLTW